MLRRLLKKNYRKYSLGFARKPFRSCEGHYLRIWVQVSVGVINAGVSENAFSALKKRFARPCPVLNALLQWFRVSGGQQVFWTVQKVLGLKTNTLP